MWRNRKAQPEAEEEPEYEEEKTDFQIYGTRAALPCSLVCASTRRLGRPPVGCWVFVWKVANTVQQHSNPSVATVSGGSFVRVVSRAGELVEVYNPTKSSRENMGAETLTIDGRAKHEGASCRRVDRTLLSVLRGALAIYKSLWCGAPRLRPRRLLCACTPSCVRSGRPRVGGARACIWGVVCVRLGCRCLGRWLRMWLGEVG